MLTIKEQNDLNEDLVVAIQRENFNRHTPESISELLNRGANPKCQMSDETTALWHAVKNNNMPIIPLLIKYGADINVLGPHNESIKMLASRLKRTEISQLLALLEENPILLQKIETASNKTLIKLAAKLTERHDKKKMEERITSLEDKIQPYSKFSFKYRITS